MREGGIHYVCVYTKEEREREKERDYENREREIKRGNTVIGSRGVKHLRDKDGYTVVILLVRSLRKRE